MISVSRLLACFLSFYFSSVHAEELRAVEVQGSLPLNETLNSGSSSELLGDFSSIHLRKNGGIADVPSIQGLANDRVNLKIDGTIVTNSCPNHMSPALSFVHPDQVIGIESYAGLDPVSNGGDNIGGSILVKTKKTKFSMEGINQGVKLRTFYKSNNFNSGVGLSTFLSSNHYYFSYEGLQEKAGRYRDGNGKRLRGTLYEQNNQAITIARKIDDGDISLKVSRASVPYQGFVNQYMDLLDNRTDMAQLTLNKTWSKLSLEFLSSFTHTDHHMNKISSERKGKMPMDIKSDEFNTSMKFNYDDHLDFGLEYFQYRLEDWWDPVGTM